MAAQKQLIKNIWMLSREYGSLAGAGGVKDVVSQLAETLARWSGRAVNAVVPCYGFMDPEKLGFIEVADPCNPEQSLRCEIEMNHPDERRKEEVAYYFKRINRVSVYLVASQRFREKGGVYTYTAEEENNSSWQKESMGHHDFFAMNILLQKATLELIVLLAAKPDIIHCHDGHTAVLPALIREYPGYQSYFRSTGCLVTIHNGGIGYHQEIEDLTYAASITALPESVIAAHLLDGKFDPFLLGGSYTSINTVSENYARELQKTKDDRLAGWLGHRLLERHKVIEGITNGIDPALFNPATTGDSLDFGFAPGDDEDNLEGKKRCKIDLINCVNIGLINDSVEQNGYLKTDLDGPLFTFVGRLSKQKGVDVFIEVLKVLMKREPALQVLFLGSGEHILEEELLTFSEEKSFHGRVCFLKGYSSELARKVYTAGDFFIMPSRYEPCGVSDFIAQLYGNIPIVHHVGGLVKVRDGYSGIAYHDSFPDNLMTALERAMELYTDKNSMRKIQVQAVREIEDNYTWSKVMKKYVQLYKNCRSQI